MPEYTAPVQIVVNTEEFLEQIGWHKNGGYDSEGDYYEESGKLDLRGDLAGLVARHLATDLRKEMTPIVRDMVTEVARDRVAAVIDDVFAAGFRKTNRYGEPVGETITLREMVIEQVQGQLERRVDERGNTPDGYGRGSMPFTEYMARKAANEALRGELGEAATAAVEEVKAKVKAVVAEDLGAKIARAVAR